MNIGRDFPVMREEYWIYFFAAVLSIMIPILSYSLSHPVGLLRLL